MSKNPDSRNQFNWRQRLYSSIGAFLLFIPALVCEPDLSLVCYFFAAMVVTVALVIALVISFIQARRCLSILAMIAAYWLVAAVLVGNYMAIRTAARWLLWSNDYKSSVLREPTPPNGEFKHTAWDGWGWGGQDTNIFLVFDPTDSLSSVARNRQSGTFVGIPCEVYRIRRVESHWYTAQLYVDEDWDKCY